MKVNMHEAKSQLSSLGEKVWKGERIIIARAGEPYLELIPYKADQEKRVLGGYENQVEISDDFDEDLSELFEGE